MKLGWSTTIHRCQEMIIEDGESSRYIVICPGTRKFESLNPGALFVALSRTKYIGVCFTHNVLVSERSNTRLYIYFTDVYN